MSEKSTLRPLKGSSLIEIPENYIIVDIETTGLDPNYDEIIEIGAIKYNNNVKTSEFSSLVKSANKIDEFITELTGITNNMLADAPSPEKVIADFSDFVGDSILIGYNVNFDINFLYDYFEAYFNKPFVNNFVDLLRLSRKLLPDLKNHKLSTVADFFKIDCSNSHRALNDCIITNECFNSLKNIILSDNIDIEKLFKKSWYKSNVNAKNITTTKSEFDENNFFYNKHCCFTGTLEKILRKDAMQLVVDVGGICENNVTQKTNYLILGNLDYRSNIKNGKSSKQKKAEALKLKGQDIEILSESLFYELIENE